jgi:hypothetical protein
LFCSDAVILTSNDVYDDEDNLVFSGRRLFVDRYNRLRSLRDSWLVNLIGISTLALTSDGKLVYTRQTKRSVGSPGLLAPSGSGALEQRDLLAGSAQLLHELIIRGVERELREETNLTAGEVERSELVGFGRWISRGAMPEFAAVTLLDTSSHKLDGRKVIRTEREYVAEIRTLRLNPGWDPEHPLDALPEHLRQRASFPLALALSALGDVLRDEPDSALSQQVRQRLDAS